jgi:hypothetical protein
MSTLILVPILLGFFGASLKLAMIVGLGELSLAFVTTLPVISRVGRVEGMAVAATRAVDGVGVVGIISMAVTLSLYTLGLGLAGVFL